MSAVGRGGLHRRGRGPLRLIWLVLLVLALGVGAVYVRIRLDRTETAAGSKRSATAVPRATTAATPSPSPSPSPTEPPRGALVVHATGDVNMDPSYITNFQTRGFEYAWSGLDGLFRRDDLTVINLECAVSTIGSPVPKEFTFRGDPASLPVMHDAGVEVADLGNNHSGDFGPAALLDTRANLEANDIAAVGAGRDDVEAHAPALFDVNGWTIAVLGFGGVVPAPDWIAGPGHPGMADGDDVPSMVAAVKAADRVADLVFVAIHWGVELDLTPRADDVARAHAMIDAGADAIFGHHTHRLNPMDTYKGRPIFWSLGNFVWPNFSVAGATTAVAEVRVRPNGKITGRLLPAFIEDAGHPVLTG